MFTSQQLPLCHRQISSALSLTQQRPLFSILRRRKREREMGNIKKEKTSLDDLIENAGGCAVIDGGFATQLERHGASINDPLWSALCLIKDPHLIKKVHLEYLEAGADILVTSSYQATLPGFMSRGLSLEEGELLLQRSVELAVEARDSFWNTIKKTPGHKYRRALVAASIGSYGAYLADGSEYRQNQALEPFLLYTAFNGHKMAPPIKELRNKRNSPLLKSRTRSDQIFGCYGADVNLEKLKDFHRRRLQVLVKAGPDLLAFETIPNKLEAKACVELLEEEGVQIPSWICFTSVDGVNAPSGESFKDCLDAINKSDKVNAVGINCAPPHFMENLIGKFKQLTKKAIVVYPNSGEIWDGKAKEWLPSKCSGHDNFEFHVMKWRDLGAKIIGGCCRTTPSTIRAISKALRGNS